MDTNNENKLFSALGKLTDSLLLNLLFVVSCIPVVTIGISCTAFYYANHKVLRQERSYLWAEYKRAWKDNFKQSTICWLIFLGIGAVLGADTYIMYRFFRAGHSYGSAYVFFAILLAIVILWMVYTFAYIARFSNQTKDVLKNSFLMMFVHFPKTFLILLILAAGAFAVWSIPLLVVIVPILALWFIEILLESIFEKYMSEEDRKAEQERNGKIY